MMNDTPCPADEGERISAAYAVYNAAYDNETFRHVQTTLVWEVCGPFQASHPNLIERALALPDLHTILNLVTDAALELCGHPAMTGRINALLRAVTRQPISADTLHAITDHWFNFVEGDDLRCRAFLIQGQALLDLNTVLTTLETVTRRTSDLAETPAQAAVLFTRAALRLVRAAELSLRHEPNRAYVEEQTRAAGRYVDEARVFLPTLPPSTATAPKPYKTLVLSDDGTYPGLVIAVTDDTARITWYKWGFDGETFEDWLMLADVTTYGLSAADCRKRFGGLPPAYQP